MPNNHLDTAFVDKAIKFATDAHAGTERRGKGFPYVIHVFEAMEIVATITNDPELLAAAALHDTVEDTDVTLDDLREAFGPRVASLVEAESDAFVEGMDESATWRSRKQAAIDRLAAAPHDAKIVALGDKLSNMRAIARDYHRDGDKLWSLFHAPGGKADHEWHYRGLAASLAELEGTEAYAEFVRHIEDVFGQMTPELIQMDDYEESGDGFTAISYNHKDGKRMMKLYAEYIPAHVPEEELRISRAITSLGLRIPQALRMVTDGKRLGVEFERIVPKKSFARAISEQPERMDEYMQRFAALSRQLHAIPCDTHSFAPVDDFFRRSVAVAKDFTEEEKKRMLAFIDTVEPTTTCIHGDLHIGNAIFNPETDESYWIDLADFRYGNPLFDMGMFYFVSHYPDDALTQRLYHISKAQMDDVWRLFVRYYFEGRVTEAEADVLLAPFAALYMVRFSSREGLMPGMREFINEHLL